MAKGRKKKIVTTETLEGDEIDEKEEEKQETQEEGYRRKTPLPEIVQQILSGELDECPPEYQDWSMAVMRWAPKYTGDNQWVLVTGKIRDISTLTSYKDAEQITKNEHGGGTYHINVLDASKRLVTRCKIVIEGVPKVTRADMKNTEENYPNAGKDKGEESKADYWRAKKEEYEAKIEAEEAKKRYEKSVDDDDDDDDGITAPPFFLPGTQPGGMGYGRPGMELVDRTKLEAQIRAEIADEFARKEERRELQEVREEMRRMQELIAHPPKSQDGGIEMKEIFKMFTEMTNKLVEVKTAPPPVVPQGEDEKMKAFAAMITGAMQNVNQMTTNMLQSTATAQQEILMQTIKNAMAPQGEKDWKLELINKGADTVKEFVGSIVDANKSRHEVEKKKLDVASKIRPVMVPRGAIKTGAPPQAPAPQPQRVQQPQAPQPPQYQEISPNRVKEIMSKAERLQQEAIAAYLSGTSPVFFARKTLEIGGQEVTNWLRENPHIDTLRQLAHEQKGDEGLAEFDKYITNNPPAREWVEQWLKEVVINFRPVDASGQPVQEEEMPETGSMIYEPIEGAEFKVQEPKPPVPASQPEEEEEEYVDIEDYEELPAPDSKYDDSGAPKLVVPEEAISEFLPVDPRTEKKSEKKLGNEDGPKESPAGHGKTAESLVPSGHTPNAPEAEVPKQEHEKQPS